MSDLVTSALIGGGSSIADTLISQAFAGLNAERQFSYNKRLADYQNQLNIENWNRQNEYNLPSNQMKRFADAGLNPNLIYGQTNTAGDVGNVNMGSVDASIPYNNAIQNAINTAMAWQTMNADIRQKNAQTDNVQAQTSWTNEKILTEQLNQMLARKDGLLKDAQKTGLWRDNFLKKLEIDNFADKWNLQKQNMMWNNLLLMANRKKVLNDIYSSWLNQSNWEKDYNLRKGAQDFYQFTEYPVKYSAEIFRKKNYFDKGVDYSNAGWQTQLFQMIKPSISALTDAINSGVNWLKNANWW